MAESGDCRICGTGTQNKCAKCKLVFYCTQKHETIGLRDHMEECASNQMHSDEPYRIHISPDSRRYFVANVDIPVGCVILEEHPLVVAPSQAQAVCLSCSKILLNSSFHRCKKCKWPLCSEKCEEDPIHNPECCYLSKTNLAPSANYSRYAPLLHRCVMIIRCLYQKNSNPSAWEKINKLQSYYEAKKLGKEYPIIKEVMKKTLNLFFGIKDEHNEDEIMRLWAICTANELKIPVTNPYPAALYELSPMIEHSCLPNCSRSIDEQGVLRIRAAVPINKGQKLSICYFDPLSPISDRRKMHYQNRLFHCPCVRCNDVTEFGMFLSAMHCVKRSCPGILLPKRNSDIWTCNTCTSFEDQHDVDLRSKFVKQEICSRENRDDLTTYINNQMTLPYTHCYVVKARIKLLAMIGGMKSETMQGLSKEDLMLKASLSKQLIDTVWRISPADQKLLGYVLFHFHLCIEEISRRSKPGEAPIGLEGQRYYLKEIVRCLKYESAITPEGRLYKEALRKLSSLEQIIANDEGSD